MLNIIQKPNKIRAFTLAEVLITLSVIGVVAAISIPALQADVVERQHKTAYRKAYADASNAFNELKSQNVLSIATATQCIEHKENFLLFKDKFSITRDCTNNNNDECWDSDGEKIGSYPNQTAPAFIDNAGRVWSMKYDTAAIVLVDTNGNKPPNHFGIDRMLFNMLTDGSGSTGNFVRLLPDKDYVTGLEDQIVHRCPSVPCYYSSWLIE